MKSESVKYETIPGYHLYHEVKGKKLKGEHSFYIREDIKYEAKNYLYISYCDKNNKFQSCCIAILNDQKPNITIDVHYSHPKKKSHTTFINKLKEV